MDYITDGNIINTEVSSDISERFLSAYNALCDAEDSMCNVEKEMIEGLPDKVDPCDALRLVSKLNEFATKIESIKEGMAEALSIVLSGKFSVAGNINIQKGMEKYMAFQIILKKYEILKLRCEKIKLTVEKFTLKITKTILSGMLSGKGSTLSAPVNVALTTLSAIGTACSAIMTALSTLMTLIQNMTIMNVNGGACCFFMTPKSLTKTAITIANTRQSLTNNLSGAVDQSITEAEESIKEANGKIKDAKVTECATNGGVSAATGKFEPTSFGTLNSFKPETVRTAVNMILQAVLDADALPRYEKLKITNVRFLTFLVTGFEPAAKTSFGIPGYP